MKESIEELKGELSTATLVAVSKTKSNEYIMEAYNLGIRDFGENYVQELITKMDTLPQDIRWHMIGHLQTNKVKDIVKRNIYLIEVNITNDPNKTGCMLEDLEDLINKSKTLSNINLLGLMAIGPKGSEEEINSSFKKMNELKKKYNLKLVSMGMSNDYKIAIKNNTDIVRIGSKIFGERIYKEKE